MEKDMSSHTKIYMLKTSFIQFRNYNYVGVDLETGKGFIVDPAWEINKIEKLLGEEQIELDKILLTHSHLDHVNLVEKLVEKHDALVFMSQEEIDFYHYRVTNLIGFSDMESIPIGQSDIRCILTPGHTRGGTCYQFGKGLFTGDTIFIEGCGICNTSGGSARSMYNSIQKIKKLISDETIIYPGHSFGKMPGQELKYLKAHNIYFQIDSEEIFAKFRNRSNMKGIFDFR